MGISAGGGQPDINMTPLIDVLLVLLIIFMVVAPLKPAQFETKVPQKNQQPESEPNDVVRMWRRETSDAALRFLDRLIATRR